MGDGSLWVRGRSGGILGLMLISCNFNFNFFFSWLHTAIQTHEMEPITKCTIITHNKNYCNYSSSTIVTLPVSPTSNAFPLPLALVFPLPPRPPLP